MEKELRPEESIKIIQQMIKASQQQFADNGIFMILWGIILIFAALTNYLLINLSLSKEIMNQWININWIGYPCLGGILSIIIGKHQARKEKTKTQISNLLKFMWIGFGISLFFIILLSGFNQDSPIPFILILTAFAIYIFALGIKYLPFMIGSGCTLSLGVVAFWLNYPHQLLAFAMAISIGYLLPGILLYRQFKVVK